MRSNLQWAFLLSSWHNLNRLNYHHRCLYPLLNQWINLIQILAVKEPITNQLSICLLTLPNQLSITLCHHHLSSKELTLIFRNCKVHFSLLDQTCIQRTMAYKDLLIKRNNKYPNRCHLNSNNRLVSILHRTNKESPSHNQNQLIILKLLDYHNSSISSTIQTNWLKR
jgi:hypothetical protein